MFYLLTLPGLEEHIINPLGSLVSRVSTINLMRLDYYIYLMLTFCCLEYYMSSVLKQTQSG